MQLKIQRSQRTSGLMGKTVVFCLDARIELTPDETASVKKYKLGGQVIYNSNAALKHMEAGAAAVASGGAGGLLRGAARLAMTKMSLNITIDGLTSGQHVECKDLDEMLGAEEAIMEGCRVLRGYLGVASTFDGRETVIDLDQEVPAV